MQDTENGNVFEEQILPREFREHIYILIKSIIFLIVWVFIIVLFMVTAPSKLLEMVVALEDNKVLNIILEKPIGNTVRVEITGNIHTTKTNIPSLASKKEANVIVNVDFWDRSDASVIWKSEDWVIYFDDDTNTVVNNFDLSTYFIGSPDTDDVDGRVTFLNHHGVTDGFSIKIVANPCDKSQGVWLGILLLVFLYVLIIFEITDRTFATMFTSMFGLAILGALHERVLLNDIISWINTSTLMLLFGMMILIAILSDTGFFDFMAVVAFEYSGGKTWRLLFYLCAFTAFCSSFLINVTIVLVMAPVTIRICEIMGLDTRSALILIVMFTNIGGALTPVGDSSNMMVATDPIISGNGVKYGTFTLHMFLGVCLAFIVAFTLIYFMLRNKIDREKYPLRKLLDYLETRQKKKRMNQTLKDRMVQLEELVKNEAEKEGTRKENFEKNLSELKKLYKIRDKPLLIKCGVAFTFLILTFFLHSLPSMPGATLEWAAVLAAWLLIILDNRKDFAPVIERLDWSTLIFFASLFVLVEVLHKLGFVDYWNDLIMSLILSVNPKYHNILSLVLIIWVSALFSAGIENIPITAMLVKLPVRIATSNIGVPLKPLVWGLVHGISFGANGTLLGALANLVMAGLAAQYGYRIKFKHFFMIGFPVMLSTVTVATLYLIIAHCVFSWHEESTVISVNDTNSIYNAD